MVQRQSGNKQTASRKQDVAPRIESVFDLINLFSPLAIFRGQEQS